MLSVKSVAAKMSSLALAVIAIAVFVATPAHAASSSQSAVLPVGQTIHQTAQLRLKCETVPNTPQAQQILKQNHLCGYSSGPAQPNGSANPDGYVSGNCGSIQNWITNKGAGQAQLHVKISAVWYAGNINSAQWAGYTYNEGTNSELLAGNVLIGPFGWTVDDYQTYYTDTGWVQFWVYSANDITTILGECEIVSPIEDRVRITA